MRKKKLIYSLNKRERELIVGDLVYHILYGKDWVGLLLGVKKDLKGLDMDRDIGLIHLQPNRNHQEYFKNCLTRYRICDNMGYVSMHWLWKLEDE